MAYDLKKIAAALSENKKQEKLALPLLVNKLSKLAELFPYDQTIVSASKILSKAQSNNKYVITRAELQDLYKRLYTRNTKFADHFADELGEIQKPALPKYAAKYEEPINDIYAVGNNVLAALMKSAVDHTEAPKTYSQEHASKAMANVNDILDMWNAKAAKLEVIAGDDNAILIKAGYDTPKGLVSILVPVSIKNGSVEQPKAFVGKDSAHPINHTNIKNYLTACVSAKLATAGRDGPQEISMPKAKEMDSFAEKLNNPMGVATFKFGTDKVNLGRQAIERTLAGFGINQPQIGVLDSENNTIVYSVSIGGKVAFRVPVKLMNNRIMTPDMMICNGSIMALNKGNINSLFIKNQTDFKVAASTSPLYGLKSNELLAIVREAAGEQNYAKVEDAMNQLEQSGDENTYKLALQEYQNGLLMKKEASDNTSKCPMVIKSGSTQYPTCGHTGLPLHKVFQDKFGNCQPLYRKDTPEQETSVAWMTSKIVW